MEDHDSKHREVNYLHKIDTCYMAICVYYLYYMSLPKVTIHALEYVPEEA